MYKWVIFCLSFTLISQAFSEEKTQAYKYGNPDPTEVLKGFIMPLKKGVSGLAEAEDATKSSMSNSENTAYAKAQLLKQGTVKKDGFDHSEVLSTLRDSMGEKGVLTRVQVVSKDGEKLNGHVQKYTYQLFFSNGKNTTLKFTLLKPTINGGYFMTDIAVED